MAAKSSGIPKKIQASEFGSLWLANLIEKEIGLADLVGEFVLTEKDEDGPSEGDYFLYAVYNRMVDSCSKRALPAWYKHTAIQHIRPVAIQDLTSQNY